MERINLGEGEWPRPRLLLRSASLGLRKTLCKLASDPYLIYL